MKFEVKLPLFEGPFDLLLFFIERDELDIYDIPIFQITENFLEYVHQLEKLNIEVASEFILVAATLMRIKAKMLLPRPVIDEEGNELDPREELIRHLLEYKRYKSVIAELVQLETDRLDRERRGNIAKEIKHLAETTNVEAELQNLDLFKLLKVYQKVMSRYELEKNKVVHQVVQYPYTISNQKSYILDSLQSTGRMAFTDLIQEKPEKIYVIFNFLAILELLQLQLIRLHLGEGYNNFWIERQEEVAVD
ncbi:segregation/condensation protein A [Reichenbachiella agarivorans]|uniref:Segregation and condensation protein A n=1 Tax=Reichenbachiella agarivorans TaxID=2979464 RepID=A0ABY6CVF9_9BACT|nr:segregation/condensation protein A [Reichenbachiella agarivorans]UXP33914.1 segregation/condensation protein A [Reichenbachiella agarivorans]